MLSDRAKDRIIEIIIVVQMSAILIILMFYYLIHPPQNQPACLPSPKVSQTELFS